MHPLARLQDDARNAAVEEYKRAHMIPAIREAMVLLGMSDEEYTRQLKQALFPYPIIYTTTSTNECERTVRLP